MSVNELKQRNDQTAERSQNQIRHEVTAVVTSAIWINRGRGQARFTLGMIFRAYLFLRSLFAVFCDPHMSPHLST